MNDVSLLPEIKQYWEVVENELPGRLKDDIDLFKIFDHKSVKRKKNYLGAASNIDSMIEWLVMFDLEEEVKRYCEVGLDYIDKSEELRTYKLNSHKISEAFAGYLNKYYRYRFKWFLYAVDDSSLAYEATQFLWDDIENRVNRRDFKHIIYQYLQCAFLACQCSHIEIAKKCLPYIEKQEKGQKLPGKLGDCYKQSFLLQEVTNNLSTEEYTNESTLFLLKGFLKYNSEDLSLRKVYMRHIYDVAYIYFKYFCNEKNSFNPITVTKSMRDSI